MPLVPPTATPIDVNELRALQRHVIGLLSLRDGGPPLLVLELTDAAGEARPYAMSLNGAVQLATDLNGVLEGDDAIRALVKETFALARDLKATLARTDAPPRQPDLDEAYDAIIRDTRCATCRATGRSPFAQPCPDCLAEVR